MKRDHVDDALIEMERQAVESLCDDHSKVLKPARMIVRHLIAAGVRIRILISLFQVLQGVGIVFAINYPPFYRQILNWLGKITLIDLELPHIMPLGCVYTINFCVRLGMRTAAPIGLCTILIGLGMLLRLSGGKQRLVDINSVSDDGILNPPTEVRLVPLCFVCRTYAWRCALP